MPFSAASSARWSGCCPGIGPLAGISILLPATFGLDPTIAIVLLAGIYYGAHVRRLHHLDPDAHSRRGRLGHDLHRRLCDGAARAAPAPALAIAAIGSFVAGTFGVVLLMLVAPTLADFALRFGPPEYTALLVLGLVFLAYMSSTSLIRTLLMACAGLLLG